MNSLPPYEQVFSIEFDNGQQAQVVRVLPGDDPQRALLLLGLSVARPVVFVVGGASGMSDEVRDRTRTMIDGVAAFAEEHNAAIVDGGTEAGIMQMCGDSRLRGGYQFPLLGVSPLGKVSFPGYANPNEEAYLEDSHTHFILVDGDEWGDESHMLLGVSRALTGGEHPAIGVLVNGGQIALQEVYLATMQRFPLPVIALEGSGRLADALVSALRTGRTDRRLLRAIVERGSLDVASVAAGPDVVIERLRQQFSHFWG